MFSVFTGPVYYVGGPGSGWGRVFLARLRGPGGYSLLEGVLYLKPRPLGSWFILGFPPQALESTSDPRGQAASSSTSLRTSWGSSWL